ncbi:MAG: PQQ-binding-like beta-propeller repeat protein, partial [Anaerolineales bacterium]
MKIGVKFFSIVIACSFLLSAIFLPELYALPPVYIEPGLTAGGSAITSVIVTGSSSNYASRAVEQHGGQITSDLWLIDAVAADVPSDQIENITKLPGIRSLVANKQVRTADQPEGDGWVTGRRAKKAKHGLGDKLKSPVAALPDGGYISVTENGKVLIANPDESERTRLNIGGKHKSSIAVGEDGGIFLADEEKRIYALNQDGSTRWVFNDVADKFRGGVVTGPNGEIYAADEKRHLYALDPISGQLLWVSTLNGDGDIETSPAVGPDGTIYLLSEKGYLWAVNPDGSLKWTFIANEGAPFKMNPLIGVDNTIYFAGENEHVYAVTSEGALQYHFFTDDKVKAQPALTSTGTFFVVTENGILFALDPEGQVRFVFHSDSGKFKTSPVLSKDEATLYVAAEDNTLYALDANDGTELWRTYTQGKIKASPALDEAGNLILGSEGQDLMVLNPNGQLITLLQVDDKIKQTPTINPLTGDAIVTVGDQELVSIGSLPDYWEGSPDVSPTDDLSVWQLAYPVVIDVGADVLHQTTLPDGSTITGKGVTVAVLDSGVYFDKHVKDVLGKKVENHFLGQADFIGDGTCQGKGGHQYDGYCFRDHKDSLD